MTGQDPRIDLVRKHVRNVPDFPKPGILFRDITPVLGNAEALTAALALHVQHAEAMDGPLDLVCGIESRGFLFGMALAARLGVGFVPIRKPGKLPAETIAQDYGLEYGTDQLQIHRDAVVAGQRVLVVDDLLATGGTAAAACSLVARLGGEVAGCLFLIELAGLAGRAALSVPVASILSY